MPPVFRNDSPEIALIQKDPPRPLEASDLWELHRALLGGKSSATGATLPERLEECPPGARLAHYGLALLVSALRGTPEPSIPAGLTDDDVNHTRRCVLGKLLLDDARTEPEPSTRRP